MLGPGILGTEEFERQQAKKGTEPLLDAQAINTLGSSFAPSAETSIVVTPPPETDDLRVSARKALELLAKDPQSYALVLAGELSRPAATRRKSVLEALLDKAPNPEILEKVNVALHELNTATPDALDSDE